MNLVKDLGLHGFGYLCEIETCKELCPETNDDDRIDERWMGMGLITFDRTKAIVSSVVYDG